MSPPPCSSASQLVLRGLTSRARASSAKAPRLPDADRRLWAERSNASSPGSQRQGASAHARFFDHAGSSGRSRFRVRTYCLPPSERCRHPGQMSFAAPWLAYALPYRRFAIPGARLGADAVRYTSIIVDSHHLLLAGLTGALRSTSGSEPERPLPIDDSPVPIAGIGDWLKIASGAYRASRRSE